MTSIDDFIVNAQTPRLSRWETLKRLVGRRDHDEQYYLSLNDYIKRIIDVPLAFAGLVLTSPVLILSGIAIKATSKGKAFYVHERLGNHGRWFNMYKLRTMHKDALPVYGDSGFRISPPNDERLTKLGRFLRRYQIDEIPQLINVLLGHISLVGPRARPRDDVESIIEMHGNNGINAAYIYDIPQGITGFTQVYTTRKCPKKEVVFYDSVFAQMYRTQWIVPWHNHFLRNTWWAVIKHDVSDNPSRPQSYNTKLPLD